jgi:hypothetical protein
LLLFAEATTTFVSGNREAKMVGALSLDTTSIILLGFVAVLLIISILLRLPPPQAHPFLLGRQSSAAGTRYPNESPVYTNSTSGGVRAPVRPAKLKTLHDVIGESKTKFEGGERGSWIKGGETIITVVMELRAGLLSVLGIGEGTVAVVVEDPTGNAFSPRSLRVCPDDRM